MTLSGEVGKPIVKARQSGERRYLAAMNGEGAAKLPARLSFLGRETWSLRSFASQADSSDYQAIVESTRELDADFVLSLSLLPGGGFAGIIPPFGVAVSIRTWKNPTGPGQ